MRFKQVHRALVIAVMFSLFGTGVASAFGATYYVDNVRGDDAAGDGSSDRPFSSIGRGVEGLQPGDTLDVANTGRPYQEVVRVLVNGTPDAPIVIEGNGAVVSGMASRPTGAWQDEGDGVFSMPLPNNAWGMHAHWEGGFALVKFDGEDGRNVTTRDELRPLTYFLYKNRSESESDALHNTLFVRLPEGSTPGDVEISTIHPGSTGFFVQGDYVTIRNFVSEYFGSDGFATHRNKGVVFEGVEGRFNMDQGMSHHGAEVVVRRSHFHHNAGGGIVDVYRESRVRYEDCLIENDTWRGGVEFHTGRYEMVNCIIRGNAQKAIVVQRGATVTLRNCLIVGTEMRDMPGIMVLGDDSSLTMEHCTVAHFRVGLDLRAVASSRVVVRNSAFLACNTNWHLTTIASADEAPIELGEVLHAEGNAFGPQPFVLQARTRHGERWSVESTTFRADEWEAFQRRTGGNRHSLILPEAEVDELPLSLPELAGRGMERQPIGAAFSGLPAVGPEAAGDSMR